MTDDVGTIEEEDEWSASIAEHPEKKWKSLPLRRQFVLHVHERLESICSREVARQWRSKGNRKSPLWFRYVSRLEFRLRYIVFPIPQKKEEAC